MRPFLFLATRSEDEAADDEYRAMLQYAQLDETSLGRHRLERESLPSISLDDWSGIIVGGSPFTNSDPVEKKTAVQLRVERELACLLDEVVPRDFPFLGACYGIGTLGLHQGALVDGTYGEPVSRVHIEVTEAGRQDPLFETLPDAFEAYVGHKEAITQLPPHAVNLASSATCPVQAFRVGRNVYATQFHPELDCQGIAVRVDAYLNHGYFEPVEGEQVKAMGRERDVPYAPVVLQRFVERYARD